MDIKTILFYSFIFIILIIFIISCGSRFNPMYYYSKHYNNNNNNNNNNNVEPPKPVEGVDPFKEGEWNDPNYGGYDGSKFDTWLFQSSFRGDKLPMYKFKEPDGGKSWMPGGQDWKGNTGYYYDPHIGENKVYDAPVVGTIDINPLRMYKYDGNNPLYGSSGYLPGRMDRFCFYSIDGNAKITLQQYLIAVDTFSKFIFAYGKITSTGNLFGNVYPTGFDAIERYSEKKDFYEYDPIGYVKSDGSVVLYEHYEKEFVKDPTGWIPSQHGFETMAQHDKSKPGHSPYRKTVKEEASEEDSKKFKEELKNFNNQEYKYRDYIGYNDTDPAKKEQINLDEWRKKGYAGKSLILYTYSFTDNGETITIKQNHFTEGDKGSSAYKLSMVNSDAEALFTNINNPQDSKSFIIIKNDNGTSIKAFKFGSILVNLDFKDYGPIFTDRVMNAKFEYKSIRLPPGSTYVPGLLGTMLGGTITDIVYQFNSDGTEFILTYKHEGTDYTYNNKLARFDSDIDNMWAAKYESNPKGSLGGYLRIVLRDDGKLVRSSMTLNGLDFPDSPGSDAGLEMKADRVN